MRRQWYWREYMRSEEDRRARYPRQMGGPEPFPRELEQLRTFNAEVATIIGRRIRTKRAFVGIRQIDLAHSIGLTQPTLSRIERGLRPVTLPELLAICVQLGHPIDAFLEIPPYAVVTGWEIVRVDPSVPRPRNDPFFPSLAHVDDDETEDELDP